jgi:hypothetical protein
MKLDCDRNSSGLRIKNIPLHVESESMSAAGQRVWRLRKLHQSVDAELREDGDGGVELRFLLNGECSYSRRWPTRALAVAEAAEKRAELEREGWMFHW